MNERIQPDTTTRMFQRAELYKATLKKLSDTILKLRPLGGSEMFMRIGIHGDEDYYADPTYFAAQIERDRASLHEARLVAFSKCCAMSLEDAALTLANVERDIANEPRYLSFNEIIPIHQWAVMQKVKVLMRQS